MKDADMKARLNELYLPPTKDFVLVEVPDMRYVMIDGLGAAPGRGRATLDHAVKWLFATIFPMKAVAKERMGKNFVEPPLEGLWWADDMQDFMAGNKTKLFWRMMIVYEPDWLTEKMFEEALTAAKERLGDPPASLRVEAYREGLSAQIMHVGPPSAEATTIARLHSEFLPAQNLIPNGYHHEIYLTDPNRVAPEKQKTVLRQPVRACTD